MLRSDDLTNLQSLLDRHGANVDAVLADCTPDLDGVYDCPMCNGEGQVDAEVVSEGHVVDRERLESIGLQVYGLGEDHLAVLLLLREALRLAPEMADTIRQQAERIAELERELDRIRSGEASWSVRNTSGDHQ